MKRETYTVRPGNTLYGIANFFSTTVSELARANGLKPPYTIYPGQVLLLPFRDMNSPRYYAVRPGDTLTRIADRYGLELDDILRLNRLDDPNIIYPGQIIRLTK